MGDYIFDICKGKDRDQLCADYQRMNRNVGKLSLKVLETEERIKYLEGVILAASDEYEEDRGYVVIEREARLIREARDE